MPQRIAISETIPADLGEFGNAQLIPVLETVSRRNPRLRHVTIDALRRFIASTVTAGGAILPDLVPPTAQEFSLFIPTSTSLHTGINQASNSRADVTPLHIGRHANSVIAGAADDFLIAGNMMTIAAAGAYRIDIYAIANVSGFNIDEIIGIEIEAHRERIELEADSDRIDVEVRIPDLSVEVSGSVRGDDFTARGTADGTDASTTIEAGAHTHDFDLEIPGTTIDQEIPRTVFAAAELTVSGARPVTRYGEVHLIPRRNTIRAAVLFNGSIHITAGAGEQISFTLAMINTNAFAFALPQARYTIDASATGAASSQLVITRIA